LRRAPAAVFTLGQEWWAEGNRPRLTAEFAMPPLESGRFAEKVLLQSKANAHEKEGGL